MKGLRSKLGGLSAVKGGARRPTFVVSWLWALVTYKDDIQKTPPTLLTFLACCVHSFRFFQKCFLRSRQCFIWSLDCILSRVRLDNFTLNECSLRLRLGVQTVVASPIRIAPALLKELSLDLARRRCGHVCMWLVSNTWLYTKRYEIDMFVFRFHREKALVRFPVFPPTP